MSWEASVIGEGLGSASASPWPSSLQAESRPPLPEERAVRQEPMASGADTEAVPEAVAKDGP